MSEGHGFDAGWLDLREPWDRAARDAAARTLDAAALASGLRGPGGVLGVLDLACGTGANLRDLAPRLGGAQRWTLVDHDRALLRALPARLQRWAAAQGHAAQVDASGGHGTLTAAHGGWTVHWQARRLDLLHDFEALPWEGVHLLTASALIDLVSEAWLLQLVDACRAHGAAVWLALSVDGRDRWTPADPDDAAVLAAFHAHQVRDKGFFGPALGPQAPQVLARRLAAAGYRVNTAASDWVLDDPAATALRRALIDGWCTAACAQQPAQAATFQAWAERRQAQADTLSLHIGHTEVVGHL